MKLNLRIKIIIMFTTVMIASIAVFAIITNTILNKKYENVAYSNLSQFVISTENDWKNGKAPSEISGIAYIYGNKNSSVYNISSNGIQMASTATLKGIADDYKRTSSKSLDRRSYEYGDVELYVYASMDNDGDYVIAICTSSFNTSVKNSTLLAIIAVFSIVIIVGDILLWFFTKGYVDRINRLGKEIVLLPDVNYENKINNYGNDEIGNLGNQVEQMRLSILEQQDIKQEMFQNLSHDLKTPIAVIKSYSEAIKDGIEDESAIDVIIAQTEILKEKANMLLELNKIEYLTEEDFVLVNMKSLISNLLIYYKHNNIEIIADLEDINFLGIEENYKDVVTNLMDNAIRYAKSKIIIILNENELSFYNDGDSIKEEMLNEIFTPYVKGVDGQCGLGMTIVYRTLDVFDMEIKALNVYNGVKFVITKK